MSPQEARLGIDLGTSSVKAVLTDPQGRVLGTANAAYDVSRPRPGWAETDPQVWWAAIVGAVREVLARTPGAAPRAIGLSGQMHGIVLCDSDCTPVRPAVLWADARATEEADCLRALVPTERARLANPLSPGMAGPILAWLQHHEPATTDRATHALAPKDWVRARLTGDAAAESSDASATLLFDVLARTWHDAAVAMLDVDRRLLPDILPWAGAPAGHLSGPSAADLALPQGIPVAAGAADTAAALLGSGLTVRGEVQVTIGTGLQIVTPVDPPTADSLAPDPVTHLYRDATPSGWYAMAASLTGGQVLDWVRRTLGAPWSELYAAAARGPRSGDPVFLPQLLGERTPFLDSGMRGAWVGLDMRHDRETLLCSALEGVAFAAAAGLEALGRRHPVDGPVRLAGGGTRDPAWRELLADALGRPLRPVEVSDASGRGACLLAEAALTGSLPPAGTPGAAPDAPRADVEPSSRRGALEARRAAYETVLEGMRERGLNRTIA